MLVELSNSGLVSDSRFAELFARQRSERGHGPRRIEYELRQREVDAEIVREMVDEGEEHWNERAATVRQKRFGNALPESAKDKLKQSRFLAQRGFGTSHIRFALKNGQNTDEQI